MTTPAPSIVGLASANGHAPDPQGEAVPKKKRRVSPTQRTIWECKAKGEMYAYVERRVGIAGKSVTVDLWGFADVLVVDGLPGVRAIQATTVAHQQAHVEKIALNPAVARKAARFLGAGNRLELRCWAKRWREIAYSVRDTPRRARRYLWTPTITTVTLRQGGLAFTRDGKDVTPWTP